MAQVARWIDGKALAQRIKTDLQHKVAALHKTHGFVPRLAVILASDDPASAVYVRNKQKAAQECGIESVEIRLPAQTPSNELIATIAGLNVDPNIDGILLQLPIPKHHDTEALIQLIDPQKDVDGLHPQNAGRLARGDESSLVPCTPLGCIRLLESENVQLSGAHVVVVGRSRLVGRPVAELLLNRNATVTLCHSKTRHLDEVIRQAEIVIAAVGRPEMIKGAWIRPGAVVIDVGINRNEKGKLLGDVHSAAAAERASALTPVPGGVGPMTIACLLENTVKAAQKRRGIMS